jgi:hypothetical protein
MKAELYLEPGANPHCSPVAALTAGRLADTASPAVDSLDVQTSTPAAASVALLVAAVSGPLAIVTGEAWSWVKVQVPSGKLLHHQVCTGAVGVILM